MATEIWRDFDPNLAIPTGLKNAKYTKQPDTEDVFEDSSFDVQTDSLVDDDINEESSDDVLAVPSTFTIVSQTVRTAPDGRQVVDVVIDVEEVDGAINYEVRVTK